MTIQYLGTFFFALAVLHTFTVKKFLDLSHHYPSESARHSIFHLLGEIEVVFGFWAAVFLVLFGFYSGFGEMVKYQESVNYTEPIFVFVIMVIAATKPVMWFARKAIESLSALISKSFGFQRVYTDLFLVLSLGSLTGSFITEPAAMTVAALLLNTMIVHPGKWFIYCLMAVLFVNISIGGALTSFAAPPILMVASSWNWDTAYVFEHFGYKAIIAVFLNTSLFVLAFRDLIKKRLQSLKATHHDGSQNIPLYVVVLHYAFLVAVVFAAHYPNTVMGIFLFFLGVTTVTKKYQHTLRLKESLLVAFFLGGIIVFGVFQRWWLTPLLTSLSDMSLYFGAAALTAVTDNAALTYLGTQVEGLSETAKYFLVAGAISGGGLTIIANAPNAAGYSILSSRFTGGMNPLYLLAAALVPTLIALLCMGFLPTL